MGVPLRAAARLVAALWLSAALCACSSRSGNNGGHTDAGAGTGEIAAASTTKSAGLSEAGGGVSAGGRIAGTVVLMGAPPKMQVPPHRTGAAGCGPQDIPSNSVIAKDGKLKDVLVRIAEDTVFPPNSLPPPLPSEIVIDRVNCVHVPRIQGVMVDARPGGEATLRMKNSDQTLHEVEPWLRGQHLWGQGEPKGAAPIVKEMSETGIHVFKCSIHRWERSFVVASPHPYFDVTGEGGTFTLQGVPPGTYEVEAWHSCHGWKRRASVLVTAGGTAQVDFTYSASDPVPYENRDEDFCR